MGSLAYPGVGEMGSIRGEMSGLFILSRRQTRETPHEVYCVHRTSVRYGLVCIATIMACVNGACAAPSTPSVRACTWKVTHYPAVSPKRRFDGGSVTVPGPPLLASILSWRWYLRADAAPGLKLGAGDDNPSEAAGHAG